MALKQYVGARYVPLPDGTWDATKDYEPLTIVDDANGNSYTSRKAVPAGTPLTNKEYWVLTGNFSQALRNLQDDVNALDTRLSGEIGALDTRLSGGIGALDARVTENKNSIDYIAARLTNTSYHEMAPSPNLTLQTVQGWCYNMNDFSQFIFEATFGETYNDSVDVDGEKYIRVGRFTGVNLLNLQPSQLGASGGVILGTFIAACLVRSTGAFQMLTLSCYAHFDGTDTVIYTHISNDLLQRFRLYLYACTLTVLKNVART